MRLFLVSETGSKNKLSQITDVKGDWMPMNSDPRPEKQQKSFSVNRGDVPKMFQTLVRM